MFLASAPSEAATAEAALLLNRLWAVVFEARTENLLETTTEALGELVANDAAADRQQNERKDAKNDVDFVSVQTHFNHSE